MKKHPVATILFLSLLIVGAGATVAYYNTKTFGFDEDAVVFMREDDGFTIFDYKVYYKDVEEFYEETKQYIPDKAYSTDPHIAIEISDLNI